MSAPADSSVTILCPNLTCRSVLRVPQSLRGKKIRCGKCGKCFLVPKSSSADARQGSSTPKAS